ncbi:MAG: hypothetical protein WAX77_02425 [Methylococcaceae bacterium]
MIGILSIGISRIQHLSILLDEPWVLLWPFSKKKCDKIAAWGLRTHALKAERYAQKRQLPLLRLEDGFLRSVALGQEDAPLSIVIDDVGIYYDASKASRLELLITQTLTTNQQNRARALIAAWQTARVSKYNQGRDSQSIPAKPYVLVIDQTFGDASIHYGLATADSFQQMLDAAIAQNPQCIIIVKVHPDVVKGYKRGHFDLTHLARLPQVQICADDTHPVSLLEQAQAVYCVTSQMGFEALLWGKRVHTFGMPFYAGWGLTQDALVAPTRRSLVSIEQLVYAALIAYPRYLDPETRQACQVERLIEWMGWQRHMRQRFPEKLYALGFSLYKQSSVRQFFAGSKVIFIKKLAQLPSDATVVIWANNKVDLRQHRAEVLRLEDGFIRSVGLGADLIRPLSWVIDRRGIYYDATKASDLEIILQNTCFDESLLIRAKQLRQRLVTSGITKYNLITNDAINQLSDTLKTIQKTIILVTGQVESDASLAYGASVIKTNLALLQTVRQKNPQAYILYKPHPDVVAGLRKGGNNEQHSIDYCDQLIINIAMGELLNLIDEVHTMTSLTGFEALLRGKKVVCYGQPFYSGWGLTEDVLDALPRRNRQLTLNELVAGALIVYPTYVSSNSHKFSTPECVLNELLLWRNNNGSALPWWRKLLRLYLKLEILFKQLLAKS